MFQGIFSFATDQIPDILIYNGCEFEINTSPTVIATHFLEFYFEKYPERRPKVLSSALWRGYFAIYEIINDELWVIDIKTSNYGGRNELRYVSVINECLDGNNGMKIDWFSGLIVIPQGERVGNINIGWANEIIFEKYKIIEIENGNFIKELNLNHNQYLEFRKRQFELFIKSDKFSNLVEDFGITDNVFYNVYLFDLLDKIYGEDFSYLDRIFEENEKTIENKNRIKVEIFILIVIFIMLLIIIFVILYKRR
jgi:hypothetical protein